MEGEEECHRAGLSLLPFVLGGFYDSPSYPKLVARFFRKCVS